MAIQLIKDFDYRYQQCNDAYAHLVKLPDRESLHGKDDEYFIKNFMAGHKEVSQIQLLNEFLQQDTYCFRGGSLFILDAHYYSGERHFLLTHKSPYYGDNGKISGVQCSGINLGTLKSNELATYLNNPQIHVTASSLEIIETYQATPLKQYALSPRELDCVPLLQYGKTNQDIAAVLGVSRRTVESHIESIKQKTKSPNKKALVELLIKAI